MPCFPDRGAFLATSAQALVSGIACAHLGCGRETMRPDATHRTGFDRLIVDLEHRIPNTLRDTAVPGCSIALIRKGEVAWSRGFGVADVASNVPVDGGTIFGAQSMSKPVFAYAVLKLCETGVLNLDAPLTRFTPERWVLEDARLDLITARHVRRTARTADS